MYHQKETARHLQAFAALALACVVFNTGSAWATDAASSDANDAPTSTTTDATSLAGTASTETTTVDGTGKTENPDNASGTDTLKNDTGTLTPSSPSSNSGGTTVNDGNVIYNSAIVFPADAVLMGNNLDSTGGVVVVGGVTASLVYDPTVLTIGSYSAVWQGINTGAVTTTTAPMTITGQGIVSLTSSVYRSLYGTSLANGEPILTNTLVSNASSQISNFPTTISNNISNMPGIAPSLSANNNGERPDPYLTLMHAAFKDWPGGSGQAPSGSTTPKNPPAGQPRSYMINIGGVDVAITQMVLITGGKAYYCPPPDPDATGPIVYDVRTLPLYDLGPAPIDDYNFATALSSATPFGASFDASNYLAAPTPEPSTLGIVAVGVLGLLRKRRRS